MPVPNTIRKNLVGRKFGLLTVQDFFGRRGQTILWWCLCECGTPHTVAASDLMRGTTRSCGCLQQKSRTTHGMSGTKEYQVYQNMLKRVRPKDKQAKNYFYRGISVCPEWRKNFKQFYADMGPMPGSGYTIERVDNNRGYSKDNCKWATRTEQARNKRLLCSTNTSGVTGVSWQPKRNLWQAYIYLGGFLIRLVESKDKSTAIGYRAAALAYRDSLPPNHFTGKSRAEIMLELRGGREERG